MNRKNGFSKKSRVIYFLTFYLSLQFFMYAVVQKKFHTIKKTNNKINIDGYIDEEAWKDALVISLDYEILPGENTKAPVNTQCLILYDNSNIYIGFKAYDPYPHQIRAHYSDRDHSEKDDVVAILLDTFNDENRAFAFLCNPLGIQMDEILSDGGAFEDTSWDAIWNSAGHINKKGFEVEMAIPFNSLQIQGLKDSQTWGFGLLRHYPRNQFHQITNFPHNRNNTCFLCQFPKLEGIVNHDQKQNIELDPTLTAFKTDIRDHTEPEISAQSEESNSQMEAGISGKWGFTPNLNLSATINPDFSQVEADVAQLDINTQFALSYPEKRPFFLEGLDFFSTQMTGVYTRSLADPLWGVKISGKEKKNAVGFFVCRDEITNLLFPSAVGSSTDTLEQGSTAAVLRYRKDIGTSSTLGVLITDRECTAYYNRLAGVDGLLRFNQSDVLRFQVLGSSTRYPHEIALQYNQKEKSMTGYAAFIDYQRKTRSYGWTLSYEDYSEYFRADLGFIPQVNFKRGKIGANYNYWGNRGDFFSFIQATGEFKHCQDQQGNLLEQEASLSLEMDMPLQSLLIMKLSTGKKAIDSITFSKNFMDLYLKIKPNRRLYLNCSIKMGDEIDYLHNRPGKLFSITPSTIINIGKHFLMSLSYDYSRLNVENSRLYSAHLLQSRLVYHFNKRTFFRGIIQYTDISRDISLYRLSMEPREKDLFAQLLFSYKINPRTVLFLGYNDNYLGYQGMQLIQMRRTFFLKIGYALSL